MFYMEIKNSISAVSHIHSLAADFLEKKLKDQGFKNFASSHGNILFQLSINGQMMMGELSKAINRNKSTTTVLARKLEKEGFIEMIPSPNDKRNKFLSLTQKGKDYNKALTEISNELQTTFFKGFSKDEKESFCKLLEKIDKNFENT